MRLVGIVSVAVACLVLPIAQGHYNELLEDNIGRPVLFWLRHLAGKAPLLMDASRFSAMAMMRRVAGANRRILIRRDGGR